MAKVEDILGATLYLGHTMQVEYTARCPEWNALPAMPVLLAPLLASKKTASLAKFEHGISTLALWIELRAG